MRYAKLGLFFLFILLVGGIVNAQQEVISIQQSTFLDKIITLFTTSTLSKTTVAPSEIFTLTSYVTLPSSWCTPSPQIQSTTVTVAQDDSSGKLVYELDITSDFKKAVDSAAVKCGTEYKITRQILAPIKSGNYKTFVIVTNSNNAFTSSNEAKFTVSAGTTVGATQLSLNQPQNTLAGNSIGITGSVNLECRTSSLDRAVITIKDASSNTVRSSSITNQLLDSNFNDKCGQLISIGKSFDGLPAGDYTIKLELVWGDGVKASDSKFLTVLQTATDDPDGDGISGTSDECPNVFGTKSNGCPEGIVSTTDSDGDGALDSEDKCPTIAPIDSKGEKVNVPQRTSDKTNPLYGCPLIQIIPNSVKVLGEPRYAVADRVPVVLSLIKDDNFDLGGLKIEAGIYETDAPFLRTFAAISPSEVLGSRNLQEIPTCVAGEENVQAADILEVSAFAFGSGDNKNEATYILLPKMPGQVALSEKNFAIQATAYKECDKTITSNDQARVTRTITAQAKHNVLIKPTCVTVTGEGTDECPTPSSSGSGTPTSKKESLTIDELDKATPPQLLASSCSFTAECAAKEGFDVSCQSAEKIKVQLPQSGVINLIEVLTGPLVNKGVCIAEPKDGATFCSFVSPLAFSNFAGDRCTSGSLILFGGIILLFILFAAFGGRK